MWSKNMLPIMPYIQYIFKEFLSIYGFLLKHFSKIFRKNPGSTILLCKFEKFNFYLTHSIYMWSVLAGVELPFFTTWPIKFQNRSCPFLSPNSSDSILLCSHSHFTVHFSSNGREIQDGTTVYTSLSHSKEVIFASLCIHVKHSQLCG